MPGRGVAVVVGMALLLSACVTGFSREAPMGAYPAGELSGQPTHFVGWKWRFGKELRAGVVPFRVEPGHLING